VAFVWLHVVGEEALRRAGMYFLCNQGKKQEARSKSEGPESRIAKEERNNHAVIRSIKGYLAGKGQQKMLELS